MALGKNKPNAELTRLLGLETRDYPPDHIPDDSPRLCENRNSYEERQLDATMEALEDRAPRSDTHVLMTPPNGGAPYRVAKGARASMEAKGFKYLAQASGRLPMPTDEAYAASPLGGTNLSKSELRARLADDVDGSLRERIEAAIEIQGHEGLRRQIRGEKAPAPPTRGGVSVTIPPDGIDHRELTSWATSWAKPGKKP
jgi:hypothetical protein